MLAHADSAYERNRQKKQTQMDEKYWSGQMSRQEQEVLIKLTSHLSQTKVHLQTTRFYYHKILC